jgi:hypothetical protein
LAELAQQQCCLSLEEFSLRDFFGWNSGDAGSDENKIDRPVVAALAGPMNA